MNLELTDVLSLFYLPGGTFLVSLMDETVLCKFAKLNQAPGYLHAFHIYQLREDRLPIHGMGISER